MTAAAAAVSMMFSPCLQAETISVLEPLIEYARKTTGVENPTVYEGHRVPTDSNFAKETVNVLYGHVGLAGFSVGNLENAGTVFVSTDHRGDFGCSAGYSSYGKTTNTGKWHTYATSAISSFFTDLSNEGEGYIEARGGDYHQGVGAQVSGNFFNGSQAVIKAYGGSNYSDGFIVTRNESNRNYTFDNYGSIYGYGGSSLEAFGMLIERSGSNHNEMVGTHDAAAGIVVWDKLGSNNMPVFTNESGGVIKALGDGTSSDVPDVLFQWSTLLNAQGGQAIVQNAGFLQAYQITNFGDVTLENGRLDATRFQNRETGRLMIGEGNRFSCSTLTNRGYVEGAFDGEMTIENTKEGHIVVTGGMVSGSLTNEQYAAYDGPVFELRNGAYANFRQFTNTSGTFKALETPSRQIFTGNGSIVNNGSIYLKTFIRDAVSPTINYRQQSKYATLAGNLELFFDWRNREGQLTADGYTNDRYVVGYNADGHRDGLDLSAFATGEVFEGTLDDNTISTFIRKNAGYISQGRFLITDTTWSPQAQEQIREAFQSFLYYRDIRIEFAGTGDRELLCRDNVFNVVNTNAFIKSGYEGATLPFAFRSDVADLTIGGIGSNWEGSIGFESISGLNSVTVKDGKRLIVYGSDLTSGSPLLTGEVHLDGGTLQLGLAELVDSTARNGYLDFVEMKNHADLVVDGRNNVGGQVGQSDLYEVKKLTGSGSLALHQGRLTIGADSLDLERVNVTESGNLTLTGQFNAEEFSLDKGTAFLDGSYGIGFLSNRGGDLTLEGKVALEGIEFEKGSLTLAADAPLTMTAMGGTEGVRIGGEGDAALLTNKSEWRISAGTLENAVGIHVAQGGTLRNLGSLAVQASDSAYGLVNDAEILNVGEFSISGQGLNGVGLVNNQSGVFGSTGSLAVLGGAQAGGVGIRNSGQMNVTGFDVDAGSAEHTVGVNNQAQGTLTFSKGDVSIDGGSAVDAVGLLNEGMINAKQQMEESLLTIDVAGGSAAASHGIVNRGTITTDLTDWQSKKNAKWSLQGGSGSGTYGLLNAGTIDVDSKYDATAGTGANSHGMVNLKGAKLNLFGHDSLSASATFRGTGNAAGLYNEGEVYVGKVEPYSVAAKNLNVTAWSRDGGIGIYNKGLFTLGKGSRMTVNGLDDSHYGFLNEGTFTVKGEATLSLYSDEPLSALGGNGTLIVESGGTIEGSLKDFMRYRTDDSNVVEVLSADGEVIKVDASSFATGEETTGIDELASFLTANIRDGAKIVITDKNWSEEAVNQIKAAIREKVPGQRVTIEVGWGAPGNDNLASGRALVFDETNVNAFLKNSAMAGTVFSGYDYRSTSSTLMVGHDSGGLTDSVGFRAEHGAATIDINNDKTFTLLGDGQFVTAADVIVRNGASFKLGSDKLTGTQGGTLGDVLLNENAHVEVADVEGNYEAGSVTLSNQAFFDNRGRLNLREGLAITDGTVRNTGSLTAHAVKLEGNLSKIINNGNLSVESLEGHFNVDNAGLFKINGKLDIDASSVLTNTGTLLAGDINFVGGYRFSEGAQLAVGAAAVEEFLRMHPEEAQALLKAGEELSPEILMAVYGLNRLSNDETQVRYDQADADGRYLDSRTGQAAKAGDGLIVATRNGGMVLDASQNHGFGTVLALSGNISGDHVVSSSHDDNRTVEVRSHDVTHGATLTLLDAVYVTDGQTLAVDADSTLKVKDFSSEALGYRPGSLVVQGAIDNAGAMDSVSGTAVVVTGHGQIRNQGRDEGYALVMQDRGRYLLDGGKTQYEKVRLEGGAIDIRNGNFAVGTNAAVDQAKAVLALGSQIHNAGGALSIGTPMQRSMLGEGDVRFGADGALMINITEARTKPLLSGTGTLTAEAGSRFIVGESTWGRHQITSGLETDAGILDVWSDDGFVNLTKNDASLSLNDDGLVLEIGRDVTGDGEVDTSIQALSGRFALPEVINGLIDDEAMSALRDVNSDHADIAFVERMLNSSYVGKLEDGSLDVMRASSLWNSATQLSAASGLSAYALDVARSANEQVTSHLCEDAKAAGFWVKVEGRQSGVKRFESSGMMTGGYKADVYGMTFGADLFATDEWTLGAALHYENGDLKSRGDYTDTRTDVEAYGMTAYARRVYDAVSVTTQLGFNHAKGDARQTFEDLKQQSYRIEGDLKSNAVTAGIRFDVRYPIADTFLLIPHAGLRYTHAEFDDYVIRINGQNAFKTQRHHVNLIDLPMGVTVKGAIAAGEWEMHPYADLTIRPALGDVDAEARVNAMSYDGTDEYRYDVAGRFAADLAFGIQATKGEHTVGMSYQGSAGTQGAQSHSLAVRYRMSF